MFNGTNGNGGHSLSDIAAVTEGTNGFFNGDGSWWIILLFLFALGGWGGFGNGFFGNNGMANGVVTRTDLCQDMNFSDLQNGVRGISQSLGDNFCNVNTNLVSGFDGVQNSLLAGFDGVQTALVTGFDGVQQTLNTHDCNLQQGIAALNLTGVQNTNAIQQSINSLAIDNMQNQFANQQGINAIQTQIAQCCCDNKSNIADIKYTMATDTCALQTSLANSTRDIVDNANANTRSILDFLVQDKISTLESENQALRLAASQQAQNNYLVEALRPSPVPAYPVPAPYPYNGAMCGCGCN